MFNRKKRVLPQKRIDCLIGAGTVVRGDVIFTGGLRIDGQISGNVATANGEPGTLVLGEHARVEGRINVSHVVVNGTVNGPVVAPAVISSCRPRRASSGTSCTGGLKCTRAP